MKKWPIMILAIFFLFSSLSVATAKDVVKEKREQIPQTKLQHSSDVTAKITTYNMHTGIGVDGNYDLDRIANTIRETGADIIGLQEVDVHWGSRSNNENTIKILAEKLDMYYFFAPIYDFDPTEAEGPRRKYGVAVLSKYPILNASNLEISRLSTQDLDPKPTLAPGFIEAEIAIDGVNIWFYVTHLDYRGDPTVREMQVDDMLNIMSGHEESILVGDLNATPDAEELSPLFHRFNDAWDINHESLGYTFPSESPIKRIDYVLTSPSMEVNNTQVHESLASDHLPVTAEVTFERDNDSLNTDGMKRLVEFFEEKGEFASDDAVHTLKIHLAAINHYESNSMTAKFVKHLKGFKMLLNDQQENELISNNGYMTLESYIEYLIGRWTDN